MEYNNFGDPVGMDCKGLDLGKKVITTCYNVHISSQSNLKICDNCDDLGLPLLSTMMLGQNFANL